MGVFAPDILAGDGVGDKITERHKGQDGAQLTHSQAAPVVVESGQAEELHAGHGGFPDLHGSGACDGLTHGSFSGAGLGSWRRVSRTSDCGLPDSVMYARPTYSPSTPRMSSWLPENIEIVAMVDPQPDLRRSIDEMLHEDHEDHQQTQCRKAPRQARLPHAAA